MQKLFARLSIGFICLWAAVACRAPVGDSRDTLIVASDLDNPPFAEVDEAGHRCGRDIDMMERIAVELGLRLEWRRMPFDELLAAVVAGEVDLVCATMGITPERARRVAFTRPYYRTEIAALVRAGQGEPTRLADLAGRRVAAGLGTTSERALRRVLPHADPALANEKGLPTVERLRSREVDAVIMDRPNALALATASGGELVALEESLGDEDYALVVALEASRLRDRLDRALDRLRRAGWLRELDERHGL